MNFIKLLILASFLLAPVAQAGSYSKSCSDDVCTITEDGKVSYEGDAKKIAKIKKKKAQKSNAQKDIDEKWVKAAKKSSKEPVYVAVMMPTSSDEGLYAARKAYHKMLVAEMKAKPNVKIVPWKKIKGKLKFVSAPDADRPRSRMGRREKEKKKKLEFFATAETIQLMRNVGIPADVILFTHLSPKSKTGLMRGSGKKGGAVVNVTKVNFESTITPLYKFSEAKFAALGKSTDGMKGVGWDKKGKKKAGEFKYKRKVEKDKPALVQIAGSAHKKIKEWHQQLPSAAASKELRKEQRKLATAGMPKGMAKMAELLSGDDGEGDKQKALKSLKGLFGK